MLLTALSSSTKNDILATPSIVTLDNMEATFNVGQEVPVLTGSQTTSGDNIFNTVERKTVGIAKVKPQINEGDSVLLEIEQEVSSVADAASSTSSISARPSIPAWLITPCWSAAAKRWSSADCC